MSFRLEYKRGSGSGSGSSTPAMFQRQVRMQVDISHISKTESGPEALYAITFTLLSGETIRIGPFMVCSPDFHPSTYSP